MTAPLTPTGLPTQTGHDTSQGAGAGAGSVKIMNSPITKLPDGSGFFINTIMSKEEAMKLNVKDRPICFRISSEMYMAVFEAIGEASMCWNPIPGPSVFCSNRASDVAIKLCLKIADELESNHDHP